MTVCPCEGIAVHFALLERDRGLFLMGDQAVSQSAYQGAVEDCLMALCMHLLTSAPQGMGRRRRYTSALATLRTERHFPAV